MHPVSELESPKLNMAGKSQLCEDFVSSAAILKNCDNEITAMKNCLSPIFAPQTNATAVVC